QDVSDSEKTSSSQDKSKPRPLGYIVETPASEIFKSPRVSKFGSYIPTPIDFSKFRPRISSAVYPPRSPQLSSRKTTQSSSQKSTQSSSKQEEETLADIINEFTRENVEKKPLTAREVINI